MILPDVNLLLYATFERYEQHRRARKWWELALNGREEVGLCAPVVFGFVRLATHRRVFERPLTTAQAIARVEVWLGQPYVRFVVPGPKHVELAFDLLRKAGTTGDLTTDVQLAALAIEHGGEVCSNDLDFGRFAGLRWSNPLAE